MSTCLKSWIKIAVLHGLSRNANNSWKLTISLTNIFVVCDYQNKFWSYIFFKLVIICHFSYSFSFCIFTNDVKVLQHLHDVFLTYSGLSHLGDVHIPDVFPPRDQIDVWFRFRKNHLGRRTCLGDIIRCLAASRATDLYELVPPSAFSDDSSSQEYARCSTTRHRQAVQRGTDVGYCLLVRARYFFSI